MCTTCIGAVHIICHHGHGNNKRDQGRAREKESEEEYGGSLCYRT